MPVKALYEFTSCECNAGSSRLDDYLGDINIPVLYIGAGGGTETHGY